MLILSDDRELLAWPYPPGKSPFTIKGVGFQGHMRYVEEHLPGGTKAMLDAFGDPSLVAFFGQPFLHASMYDLHPLAVAGVVCAKLCGLTYLEFLRVRSVHQAQLDVRGVYKFLARMVSTSMIATRLPLLFQQIFGFGKATVTVAAERDVRAAFDGMPRALAPWIVTVGCTYLETVLTIAGAKEPRVTSLRLEPQGTHGEVPVVGTEFQLRWSP
jgi:hypothetical protein